MVAKDVHEGTAGLDDNLEIMKLGFMTKLPVYGRLLGLIQERARGELGERLARAWQGRRFFILYDRPLLLLASLRFDALLTGESHPLWRALAAAEPDVAAATGEALDAALAPERARAWSAIATRHVQTNETSRAVAWLWPALLVGERPIALADLGCSAGLNLVADALPMPWTDGASGAAFPVARHPEVVARFGLDARPIDVTDEDAATWLRAAIWPGQHARLARLDAAIAAMRDARTRAPDAPDGVEIGVGHVRDAPGHLVRLAGRLPSDGVVIAYQTVMREYLPPDEREDYLARMNRWTNDGHVWIELEWGGDGATPEIPAALWAHAGGESFRIARCDYHPAGIWPDAAAVDGFLRRWRGLRGTS